MKIWEKIYKFLASQNFSVVDLFAMFSCGYFVGKNGWQANMVVIILFVLVVIGGISKYQNKD